MTASSTTCPPKILSTQNALLNHVPGLTHTPLTLTHSNGFINAVKTTNPTAESSHTLYLLHGWGAGLAMYYSALPHLSYKTVYAIDLPGMAGSSREPYPDSYEPGISYFVDALDEAFQQLPQHAKRILVAHSLGGYIAAEWQLQKHRFHGVVLVSPVGVPHPPSTSPKMGLLWRALRKLWAGGVTPQAIVRVFGKAPVKLFVRGRFSLPEEDVELVSKYIYEISSAPAAGERSMNVLLMPGAWARVPLQGRLAGLNLPIGFLYGQHDWMDWTAGEIARKEVGWSCLERVRGAGHHVFVDQPKEFARVLKRVVLEMEKQF